MKPCSDKRCERSGQLLPLTKCGLCLKALPADDFGICRSRASGRNLYCKACVREKVKASRRALKEYKEARKQRQIARYWGEEEAVEVVPKVVKLTPVERVREAVENGARTQQEIRLVTKLGKDEIGDALANLLLWTKEIRTVLDGDIRIYLMNTVEDKSEVHYRDAVPLREVARKAVELSPFDDVKLGISQSKPIRLIA